jgi:hypothetical protein
VLGDLIHEYRHAACPQRGAAHHLIEVLSPTGSGCRRSGQRLQPGSGSVHRRGLACDSPIASG